MEAKVYILTDEQRQTEIKNPKKFLFGGNAEFTIQNLNTGTFYKYRVKKSKDNDFLYFVRVMGDNGKWFYAGYLNTKYNWYRQGANGKLGADTPQIKGLLYIYNRSETLPRPMIMMHHGRCCRCGRKLNDPISVARGFGPECAKKFF